MPERGFKVIKIAPDGRCLFRALAAGMSYNQGYFIVGSEEEEHDAGARPPAPTPTPTIP